MRKIEVFQFYTNENFPQPTVNALRKLGYDVQTSHDAGNSNISMNDNDVLQYAIRTKRTLLTQNRWHFIKLHQLNQNHFGIIVCKIDTNFERLASKIDKTLSSYTDFKGKLIRINL